MQRRPGRALAHGQPDDTLLGGQLPGLHAQPVASLAREMVRRDALGFAAIGDQEDLPQLGQQGRPSDKITHPQLDPHHPGRGQPHWANLVLAKADGHALGGDQQQLVLARAEQRPAQPVALVDFGQREGVGRRAGQLAQGGFLNQALGSDGDHKTKIAVLPSSSVFCAARPGRHAEDRRQPAALPQRRDLTEGDAIQGVVRFWDGVDRHSRGLAALAHQVERVAGVGAGQPGGGFLTAQAGHLVFMAARD